MVPMLVDVAADAAILRFAPTGQEANLVRMCSCECSELRGDVHLDVDDQGRLQSIEILGIRAVIPTELLR